MIGAKTILTNTLFLMGASVVNIGVLIVTTALNTRPRVLTWVATAEKILTKISRAHRALNKTVSVWRSGAKNCEIDLYGSPVQR